MKRDIYQRGLRTPRPLAWLLGVLHRKQFQQCAGNVCIVVVGVDLTNDRTITILSLPLGNNIDMCCFVTILASNLLALIYKAVISIINKC